MNFEKHIPGSGLKIIPASWRDFGELYRLEKICFQDDAWPFPDVLGVLTLAGIIRLKAVDSSTMVGFIAADLRPRQSAAWIATFAVLPAYQRMGIGTALLEACEAQIPQPVVRLSVRRSNTAAIQLYEKQGYRRVNVWPNYYGGKEDALIFEKHQPAALDH